MVRRRRDGPLALHATFTLTELSMMEVTSNTIAFASGKGGVGKSVVTVNLAEALARKGHSVALIDADLGQSDSHILLNESPATTVLDTVHDGSSHQRALHETEAGITLAQAAARPHKRDRPGGEALYEAMDELLSHLRDGHDYILIDGPSGTRGPVRWALDRADLGALVLVGEATAVADAYRLVKMLWTADPDYPLGLVVNYADDETDAHSIAERFEAITTRFLDQSPSMLGWVPFAHSVRQSVSEQTPIVRTEGPVQNAFSGLAHAVVHRQYEPAQALPY
jgi:flagellar biosynthesis protein FlhG